jgi:biotin carboxylase
VSEALGLPLYGPTPDQAWLGSKSGSRQVARRAGVPVLDGEESLFGLDALESAIAGIHSRQPGAEAVVVKLNNGFSGQGNVMIELDGAVSPLASATTTFCASEESWPTFSTKVADEGAIVEELVRRPGIVSPSVQLRIAPAGDVELVSTHDQVLGGPGAQVYLGCRFPAAPEYRAAIQDAALSVGEVLATEGVMGSFGIDFLVVPGDGVGRVYLSEINLRLGGTTHPYWMARLVTGGSYDQVRGELVADGQVKTYVASDNIKSPALLGVTPATVVEAVDKSGLGYDQATATGSTLHLLGAVPGYGKMGATCIADDLADAEAMYQELVATVVR